ncbi:restriction endonuclease subunit S [Marinobacterium aestuariivivens]|uniref:Restriction endonuclease subunit S n=1 Tax=Marinobacterium aestuariivivens TaxID=1698799 RepID=A0ABW2A717_9GAMM
MQQQLIKLLKEKRQAVISHAVTKGLNPNAPMKDSGVEWLGEVPEHWDLIPLKHCTFDHTGIQMGPFGGMLKDLDYEVTGYKVYGQENTISGDFSKGSRWISEKRYQQLENYHLHNGDIVITRKGSLGKARIIRDLKIKGIIDSDTIRIRLNNNVLNPELLSFLLHNSFYIQEQISRERRGAILSGLNSEVIGNLKIIISPIEEQRKLIRYLQSIESKYEKATRKSESAITLLEEKRRALISSVVTGKIDVRDWKPQSAPEAPPIAAAVTVAAATP